MKLLKLFALVGFFLSLLRPQPTLASAQLSEPSPHYVVIGAFKYHKNAIRFTNRASKEHKMNARFEMNPNRNLYYVYVLNTDDRDYAIAEATRLREESPYNDTWVYNGYLGKNPPPNLSAHSGVDINPVTQRSISPEQSDETEPSGMESPGVAEASARTGADKTSTAEDDETIGKKFFFSIARMDDKHAVEGDVDVIDHDKLRKIGSYKGNTDVRIASPPGKSGQISLICEVFGYRKMQRDIDYNNPAGDGISTSDNGSVVIPFELVRLQKGDIATMFHVYFFKDAAIMRPESRYEVNSLLEMLQENTKYKIRIHGHANGKASGKIIYLEDGSTNFFSLNKTKEGFGSAKKLSQERADLIKAFLVSNGVPPDRMQTKAWGGKRPIHDKHSSRAQENVRVEIEILEN